MISFKLHKYIILSSGEELGYSQSSGTQKETQSITYRLPKRILEQLELEAKQNNISENVLVRQILTNYVDWFRLSKGTGMMPITKESLQKISKNFDGILVNNIVENISSLLKNFSVIKYGKSDLEAALDSLSMYVQMSNSQLVHLKEGNNHRFMINHNLGMTWSLVLEQLLKEIFGAFVDCSKIRFRTNDDSIIASMALNID